MRKLAKLITVLLSVVMVLTMMASARTADAVVFADFDTAGDLKVGTQFPNSPLWLNFANNTKLSIVDKALKVEFEPDGNFGIGNPTVNLRAENGEPTYKYLVIRIKGEKGNENRTAVGGLIVSIGGAEGSHMRSLNDREVGVAIPALDKNGNVMPAITTQFQNFVIPLTKEKMYVQQEMQSASISTI